jgi:hypothetical protein
MFVGKPLASPANIELGWKGLSGTNTSLLRKSVNYSRKKFHMIGPQETMLRYFYDRNKLEGLFLSGLSSQVSCLSVMPGAHPTEEHMKGVSLG